MPTLSFWTSAQVNQAGADEARNSSALTCFGLPGTAGINPSMSSCHFEVKLAVYDYTDVYLGINGRISDPVIANSGYDSGLWFSPNTWGFATQVNGTIVDGNGLVVDGVQYVNPQYNSSAGKVTFYKFASIDATNGSADIAPTWASGKTAYDASYNPNPNYSYGWYLWDMGAPNPPESSYPTEGYVYIGKVSDFGAGEDQNGIIYIGGTGTYAGTNYNYPAPYRITIPGWHPQATVTEYYPCAIYNSGWKSCNRTGGSCQKYTTAWGDVKCADDDSKKLCQYYQNGWIRAPLL